jgi:hypothetical protein
VDNGSFDSDGTIVSRSLSPAGPYPKGVTGVTLTVTDNDGLADSCEATITVVDKTAPQFICPANFVTNLPVGVSNTVVQFAAPVVSDNCGTATVEVAPPSGSLFPIGTNTVLCLATDTAGNTNACVFDVIVNEAPPIPRDLGIIKMKATKKITLKGIPVTKKVTVTIQNRGSVSETITADTVKLDVISLGGCTNPAATVISPTVFPVALPPKKKLNMKFDVTYDCANDPLATTKTEAHWDYRYMASLAGGDSNAQDDVCPRDPSGTDKGCGGKKPDKTLGADVLTDVVVKQ